MGAHERSFRGVGHHPQALWLVAAPFSFSNLYEVITHSTLGYREGVGGDQAPRGDNPWCPGSPIATILMWRQFHRRPLSRQPLPLTVPSHSQSPPPRVSWALSLPHTKQQHLSGQRTPRCWVIFGS